MKGIVVAGTHSGVGKTTVATGIMALLCQRRYKVQPFKVGPDYIDPSYHTAACGLPCRNLDTWLLKHTALVELFHRAMRGRDLAVVEGVMGLYDGFHGETEEGSTAEIAKLLGLPVILVIDASAAARSVGAAALGFKEFDPAVNLAGIILNGIAGEKHLDFIRPALQYAGVPLLGYLPKRRELALPERHLGLIPTIEGNTPGDFYDRLMEQVKQTIDMDSILSIAAPITVARPATSAIFPAAPIRPRVSIAVAKDRAFNFYYADSLDLLEAWGAELCPFSPLEDDELPRSVGGFFIGGGFPEFYARELSANDSMRRSIGAAAKKGLPTYAECGGLMYLGKSLTDSEGQEYPMAGVVPCRSSMRGTRLTLGYREISALDDNLLMKKGESVRGHEFHLSALEGEAEAAPAYSVLDATGRHEGFQFRNGLASYIHLHFGSKQSLAPNFIEACSQWKAEHPE